MLSLCRCALLRLLAEVGLNATVDVQDLSVDEARCIGREEDGRACQIFGIAPTARRGLGIGDKAVEGVLRAVRLRLTQRSRLRRGDITGTK